MASTMTVERSRDPAFSNRQDLAAIRQLSQTVRRLPHVQSMCDALPHGVMILNLQRQIVFSNRKLVALAGLTTADQCLGLRPGELFHCIHSETAPAGCGASAPCRVCGALLAVLESQLSQKSSTREMRLTARTEGHVAAYDFRIWAAPFACDRQRLTMVQFIDISDEKRRRVLERIFFHDLLNTAGSLYNMSQLNSRTHGGDSRQYANLIHMASKQLVDEIKAQRELMEAESGELKVNLTEVHSLDCLSQAIDLFAEYLQAHHIAIERSPASMGVVHRTDRSLLMRVLSNLVKNALEACTEGQAVTVGCNRGQPDSVAYWVQNPAPMSRETQMQIFQRSFSTKGAGRGLGTYSIRLLSEKFLKGRVTFDSSEQNGTRFTVTYPIRPA